MSLSSLNGSHGWVLLGELAGDLSGFSVSAAGDVNGDGFGDVIVGSPFATSNAGKAYVVFGSKSSWPSSFNLALLNGTNGFALDGAHINDLSGTSVSAAGDVNGDDILVGASEANSHPGKTYVVFGSNSSSRPAHMNLSLLDGVNGFVLNGENIDDESGFSVSAAGDVNGDGVGDILVGAYWASSAAGKTYVVFGSNSLSWPASMNLSSLNGVNGFVLNGQYADDHSGYSVSSAGDVNGDGVDDILVGAYYENALTGKTYVVFGSKSSWPSSLSLSLVNGANGFALIGESDNDFSGHSVSAAGDVNGDGVADILVGAPHADSNVGKAYVIFGIRATPVSAAEGGGALARVLVAIGAALLLAATV
jgi:hypothetical protein